MLIILMRDTTFPYNELQKNFFLEIHISLYVLSHSSSTLNCGSIYEKVCFYSKLQILLVFNVYKCTGQQISLNSQNDPIRQNLNTNYICKRPIIYARGRLYIQEADYIFLMALSHWSIQQIEIKIIIQKIKVKTSGQVNAEHLITYS